MKLIGRTCRSMKGSEERRRLDEEERGEQAVTKPFHMIGLEPGELAPVKLLVSLLRHPDPSMGELALQALVYLEELASRRGNPEAEVLGTAG
jgi:hypothetical protein